MKSLFLISMMLMLGCFATTDISIGLLVSKGGVYTVNSYCKEGFYFEIAAQVAIEYVNNNVELVKDRKLHLDVRDIKRDSYETLTVTRELITSHLGTNETSPIAVIIGADEDDLNQLVQLTAKEFTVPQISFESHSTELSDIDMYPMFTRLSASQDLVATALLKIIQKYRWERVNIIAPDDTNGGNAIEELRKAVERMPAEFRERINIGNSIRYPAHMSLPLEENYRDQLDSALETMKKSETRVSILFADPTQAGTFLYQASLHGMTGTGWTYLGTDWNTMQTFAGLSLTYQQTVKDAMEGMVGISPYIGNVAALEREFENYLERHPELQDSAKQICGSRITIKRAQFPEYTIFVYDAVITAARGIQSVLELRPNATFSTEEERLLLHDKIMEVSFDGQSGMVHFKPTVGDRLPVKMEVVNFRDGEVVDIGDAEFRDAYNYTFVIDRVPQWPGGTTAVPTDRYDPASVYLALYMSMTLLWMIVAFIFGAVIEYRQFLRIPEAGVAVGFGIIAGLILRTMSSGVSSSAVIEPTSFTLLLLPAIVFESVYNMKTTGIFFKNIGTILIYGILGSLFSAVLTAIIMSFLFRFYLFEDIEFSGMECLIFGSLISATDPVSTLSVFSAVAAEPMLTMLIYGESVINDAVTIAWFNTMSKFLLMPVSFQAIMQAVSTFLAMFFGSTIVGIALALVYCLIQKHVHFPSKVMETLLVFLAPYLAFELAEGIQFSGITATLACGITMNYFGLRNLSKSSQEFSQNAVKVVAKFCETLIFFQVGENVFLSENYDDIPWKLVITVFLVILFVRFVMVFGFTYFINLKRIKTKISLSSQLMMVHAGLRGSSAFCLALVFPSHNERIVSIVTMWIIIITIFLQGSSTIDMLKWLNIPVDCVVETSTQNTKQRSVMASDGSNAAWFAGLIERYVIPFFSKNDHAMNEPLLRESEMDREFQMHDTPVTPGEYIPPTLGGSVTRVIKGQDGRTYVRNVADVEADTLKDDKDMFVISDDDVESEFRDNKRTSMDLSRISLSSRMLVRKTPSGRIIRSGSKNGF